MWKRILVLVLVGILVVFLFRHAGSFLVIQNDPEHADLIVVLAGGDNDLRYWNGVKLMQESYAPRLMLDVFAKGQTFGHADIELAQEMLNQTTPGQSTICPLQQSSTYDEAGYLGECLAGLGVKSILLVTSNYHTRRSSEILHKRLPQYQFSFYGAPDPYYFGERWWTNRQWAKTVLSEWERYLWWICVDRWRSDLVAR